MIKNVAKVLLIVSSLLAFIFLPRVVFAQDAVKYWEIQSIDTMKYSRDLARERKNDEVFERIIETNIEKIAEAGASHVAVGTPYDEEFIPYLKKWVDAIRARGLKVWFRGNMSGWEGWFGYPAISPEEHIIKIEEFIFKNAYFFEDGDIFTSCTECENGALGDPRETGEVKEYRDFLFKEYDASKNAFRKIEKKVEAGYFSMNADVARLVMDRDTTKALGGVVVIDHYVKDPKQLAKDVSEIAEQSGGEVVLGEIGAPIPDIHGHFDEQAQKKWLDEALSLLSKEPELKGINYWVSFGGTTAIWNADGNAKPAVEVLTSYFKPNVLDGVILNELGRVVSNALVIADAKTTYTNKKGEFELISNPSLERVVVNASTYKDKVLQLNGEVDLRKVVLKKEKEGIFFKIQKFFISLFN